MPNYRVETPEGNFRIESPDEMTDDEINQLVDAQSQAPADNIFDPNSRSRAPHPDANAGFMQRTGRRVGEAVDAAFDIPSSTLDLITGGEKGRLEAALRLLQGVGSPVNAVLAPIEASVEYAATPYLSEEGSRTAGSISSLPFTLGVGLLAKAGKLGAYGMQTAKVLGVGATDALSQFKKDPQLRYAAQLPAMAPEAPILEQLTRTAATAEELAMAIKSPVTAATILKKYAVEGDIWLEGVRKNGFPDGPVPAAPVMDVKDIISFQVTKPFDIGIISTVGTPTHVAMNTHPLGAKVALDMAEAEMKLVKSIATRELRTQHGIGAVGDKAIADAVKLRNVKDFGDIIVDPKIKSDVKSVVQFLKDKFDVDVKVLVPRLREIESEKIHARLVKEEAAKPLGSRLTGAAIDQAVAARTAKLIPTDAPIDDLLMRIFPTYYKIMDKSGKFIESANNRSEAMQKIKDLADAGGLKASDFKVTSRATFDSDMLKNYQGRVARVFEHQAKSQGLSAADVEAATRGDFSMHAPTDFFNQLLGTPAGGMTRDVTNVLNAYDRILERFLHVNEFEKAAKPVLRELRLKGYPHLVDMLYTSLNALKGHRSPIGSYVDNTLAGIPGVNKLVSPYFLERWTTGAKNGIVNAFLRWSPRFHAVNATQMAQTLYPIVDNASDILKAGKSWASGASDALLTRHGIKGIGSRVEEYSKGLGPIEGINQQVSFLTMYNKARYLGLSDDQAAAYGRLRGNLHSQFVGLLSDIPKAFQPGNPIVSTALMFQRFPVKNFELVMDLVKNREFPGVGKWLAVNLAMGGMKAATLGNAGWLTLEAYDKIKREFGGPVADVMHVGLPGLLGLDMSNSVMFYNPPFGDSYAEKVGNLMGGPIGSVLGSVIGAASATNAPEPEAAKRVFNALVNSLPVGRELYTIAKLIEGDYDLKDPLGRLRYKASFKDMLKKAAGFRTLEEANIDTAVSAMIDMKEQRDAVINYAASRYGQAKVAGIPLGDDMEALVKGEVEHWNSMWPEFPITGDAIRDRTLARAQAATTALRDRMLRSMPKVIREAEQFKLPPGGG